MADTEKGITRPVTWAVAFHRGSVFLAFAIPFVGLVGMIAGAWSVKGEWGTAADWIQAIGSLIAIGIAVAVPAWQRKQENLDVRGQELQGKIDKCIAMRSLLADQYEVAAKAVEALCGADGWGFVLRYRTRKHETALAQLAHHALVANEVAVLSLGAEFVSYLIDYRQRAQIMGRISTVKKADPHSADDPEFSRDLRSLQQMHFEVLILQKELTDLIEKFEVQRCALHDTALQH